LCAERLKINHIRDNVIKTVHFICASALNHCEFVALLEEVENNNLSSQCQVVKSGICFEMFYLLNEIKLFTEKKGRNIE
jgi:hypothetical protein